MLGALKTNGVNSRLYVTVFEETVAYIEFTKNSYTYSKPIIISTV